MAHIIQTWSTEKHFNKAERGKAMNTDAAAYLGWRTGLCCHRGWPGTSPLLSGTAETGKTSQQLLNTLIISQEEAMNAV